MIPVLAFRPPAIIEVAYCKNAVRQEGVFTFPEEITQSWIEAVADIIRPTPFLLGQQRWHIDPQPALLGIADTDRDGLSDQLPHLRVTDWRAS